MGVKPHVETLGALCSLTQNVMSLVCILQLDRCLQDQAVFLFSVETLLSAKALTSGAQRELFSFSQMFTMITFCPYMGLGVSLEFESYLCYSLRGTDCFLQALVS